MGLFSRQPQACIICHGDPSPTSKGDSVLGHYMGHLDDADQTSQYLRLACGCSEAVYDATSDFPSQVASHLRARHGIRV